MRAFVIDNYSTNDNLVKYIEINLGDERIM